jgi:hypothetical protein
MKTPATIRDSVGGSAPLRWPALAVGVLALILAAGGAARAADEFNLGFADYQNIWFTEGLPPVPGVGDYSATGTAVYQGHTGPYAAPASGDMATTPTNGTVLLWQSAFGQPVGGRTMFGADFKLGQEITPPAGDVAVPLNHVPIINPSTHAFYVASARKVFAGDYGLVSITWSTVQHTSITLDYVISPETIQPPVRIYHTEAEKGGLVDLASAPTAIVHYNTFIKNATDLWVSPDKKLHAKDETGMVVMHYDAGTSFCGIDIVEVRPYIPDYYTSPTYVGSLLTPRRIVPNLVISPTVSRGDSPPKPYLYQYATSKDPQVAGQVFPVRPTSANNQIHLFWKHWGRFPGVQWPYEMNAYEAQWDPATDWQRIYYTSDGSLGPPVNLGSVDIVQFFYNDEITTNGTIFVYPNPFQIRADDANGLNETGRILLRMDDLGSTKPSALEFVEVFRYFPDYTTALEVGNRLLPTRTVATPSQPDTFVRRGLGNIRPADNLVYQHAVEGAFRGAVFAIRPTTPDYIEIFFRRKGVKGLVWPYEMHRYTATWPVGAQLFVRGTSSLVPGPQVTIPKALSAQLMPYQEQVPLSGSPAQLDHASLSNDRFVSDISTKAPGDYYAVLQYQTTSTNIPGSDWVGFQVIKSVRHSDSRYFDQNAYSHPWGIGTEITDSYHKGPQPGFIYHVAGDDNEDKYDPRIYNEGGTGYSTGQVFPVFPGNLEVWWSNVTTHGLTTAYYPVQWPSNAMRYACNWPGTTGTPGGPPETMIIATQIGSGMVPLVHRNPDVYYQNDTSRIGYNPNYEHAQIFPFDSGVAAFALRCDLNADSADKPYPFVLLKYRDSTDRNLWRFRVFSVIAQDAGHPFWYSGIAGRPVPKPYPLAVLPDCGETTPGLHNGNYGVSGAFWQDRTKAFWARAASDDGGTSQIVMRYWYPLQEGFIFPNAADNAPVGTRKPWLNKLSTTSTEPVDIRYTVSWPLDIPLLMTGETLVRPKYGLPDIMGQGSVERIYESLNHGTTTSIPGQQNIRLIDPIREREVDLAQLPDGADAIPTLDQAGKKYFLELPPHLRNRVSYDPNNHKLELIGEFYDMLGEDLLLVNVLTQRDKAFLTGLTTNQAFRDAVDALYQRTSEPIILTPKDSLSAGKAVVGVSSGRGGYVTLAMQNHPACNPLPVSLEIIRVVDNLYRGEIKVIEPDCCFDEKLTLRHSGDFAGKADQYVFLWNYHPDVDGTQPTTSSAMWFSFPTEPLDGQGALDVTIRGAGIFTLSDNWFRCRYRRAADPDTTASYSQWTMPQLAPGWIKRVIGRVNPFTQRASGGGIQGAEERFSAYQTQQVNTIVSMISQSGPPWAGNVPMNCGPGLNSLGLIEIYDTVLGRGKQLSVDAGYRYPPANNALLLAAGRIADLYTLLGNEAYADAADPTIAYGTEDGTYGREATSIHCFMNQTASLLEEELCLLRGRDDSRAPGVQVHPLYNRLMWNFTRDITGGEVAYALNYNIQDALGNADGTISELDAMRLYPQGHGDAWGHYLTAIKRYYDLLKHRNFDWVPRSEAVLVGGQPVTVDYLDERKFAKVAAAKARTGAEIADLSYRQAYVEDPEGQWQGYKDTNPDRAWGLSEWASRAGQGTYFDWVTANAILPSSDTVHTGIQKIDRTTVAELREIPAAFDQIQTITDQADLGLNPLGLAKNVVPFDIDPAEVAAGKTHFEQIYDRAVVALNNAVTVFDHATNCTQLLRRQADAQGRFQETVENSEADFTNRLIEIFGYPYDGDIGEGKTYPQGYDGPDLYHFDYVDPSQILGRDREPTQMFTIRAFDTNVDQDGNLTSSSRTVDYHVSTNGFGLCVPDASWGRRRAPGEIQKIRSQLVQLYGQFEKSRLEYAALIQSIQDKADEIDERSALMNAKLGIKAGLFVVIETLNVLRLVYKNVELVMKGAKEQIEGVEEAAIEGMPASLIVGIASGGDLTSIARGCVKATGDIAKQACYLAANAAEMAQMGLDIAKETAQFMADTTILGLEEAAAVKTLVGDLQTLVRQEEIKRLEVHTLVESVVQAAGEYSATLARGMRLWEDRTRFRTQTASRVQDYRYKDMAFRIFRNDALQKYRAQFDLAARYVYLAAKSYDYETNLLDRDRNAGEFFMTSIVRARSIGSVINNMPQTGAGLGDPGLADIMARMKLNWDLALKGQLGFNNPQTETNRFSLRYELFRSVSDEMWREVLTRHSVANLLDIREFKRYCRPFHPSQPVEPGIVIPIPTTINFGFNFFGKDLAAGDSSYDSTNFATKVRSVGVWFTGYDALTSQGLSNTPRVYLVPVGNDIMRSPTGESGEIRTWKILDQKLPVPFPIGPSDLGDPSWIPIVDTLSEEYAALRQYSSFRAYHDSGQFDAAETSSDTRLIGRSVWNTQWLLIIPAGTLHADRQHALDTFVNGVKDIKVFFQTYAYSGN